MIISPREQEPVRTVLVTGSNGQLGCELRELSADYSRLNFVWTDIGEMDIADERSVLETFKSVRPDIVINAAAYTAVDRAETERAAAWRVNADSVVNLAKACRSTGAFLVHISTDFVFDGRRAEPYRETDRPRPLSVYARTKRDGERALMKFAREGLVIRTSWLYSAYGKNFVKTVLRVLKDKGEIGVVYDQTGTPTHARDLAKVILDILPAVKRGVKRIYHYSDEGVASWYDLAVATAELAGQPGEVKPIRSEEYPLPARRPAYSVLDKGRIRSDFGLTIPHWRASLAECIGRIRKGTLS